ncbi:ABC-type transport system involved in multi-copper enzyme maturation permease subunit [Cryobacterium sp. CAN_C3]|uniref:hypothetical protein n=1 Tax=unclassified Cryobacterium TaxID=2649013 RepID=UPI0018C91076|nr:hypothetical protein [Cryobacterium sp. CAN_C3]MEC5156024.1 ABC-type transport system involved in multi-copper enzyme maturation permease subunit [Cryobacterium sp. CAN_C3]
MSSGIAWLVGTWTAFAVLIATTFALLVLYRNKSRLAETQLALIAQPRINAALGIFAILVALVLLVVGIVFLGTGEPAGRGFLALVLAGLLVVAFFTWIAWRPFPKERADPNA